MKKIMIAMLGLILMTSLFAQVKSLTGAGATFPYPIYGKWAYDYEKIGGVKMNYQSIGSGGGIQQISNKTVDFGASDAPLKGEELDAKGLIQFPMIIGGAVPVFNISGVESLQLKLDGDTLGLIFIGEIKKWNDPRISKLNPGINLPAKDITVVHRADGSGTSFLWTHYLSGVCPKWKNLVGYGSAVEWPTGVGGKGNEGVASYVKQVDGGIGYVEYAYALQNKMKVAQLKNKDGNYVSPSKDTFAAAALNANWSKADHFYLVLTNQPGKDSWPVTGASFILIYKNQESPEKAETMLKFFDWCYRNGADLARGLDYIPIPESVYSQIEKVWSEKVVSGGKKVWGK
jgi:phosphate transport system substrate-binding protein